jgi:hypothetical protein
MLCILLFSIGICSKTEVFEQLYYDLDKHEITALCDTSLWNWQQVSRLRWNPVNENQVVFNAIHNSRYCVKVYNIVAKKEVRCFDMPLYDINTQFILGLSLNFFYCFEFKLTGTAEEALAQIDRKAYLFSWQGSGKELIKVGVSFDHEKRNIGEWKTARTGGIPATTTWG